MTAVPRWLRPALRGAGGWGVDGERSADRLPRGGARGSAWMAVGALLVGLVATPFGVDLTGSDFGRLADGLLQVRTADGWEDLEAPATVPAGAELRAGPDTARIEVPGAVLHLDGGAQLLAEAGEPRVHRGSVLVEADEVQQLRVGATTAEGRGQWRVDVGVSSRVATYRARLDLDDGVSQREVGRFRQVSVRDGGLEPGLRPLRYDGEDTWDEWLLADALAVDRLAARLHGTLGRTYGADLRDDDFYTAFTAVDGGDLGGDLRDLAVRADGERFGPPADVLVGLVTVDALAAGAGLSPGEALERAVRLRRAGATWGLVLVEHDLGASALRDATDRALQQVELTPPPEPEEPPGEADGTIVPVDADESTPAPGEADGEPTADPAPAPAPSPTPAPEPDGDDPDGTGTLDPVDEVIRDTGDTVGDLVEDTGDTVGGLVEDTGGTVGDVLQDTTDGLGDTVGDVGSLLDGQGGAGASGSGGDSDGSDGGGLLDR